MTWGRGAYIAQHFERISSKILPLFGLTEIKRHFQIKSHKQGGCELDFIAKHGSKRIGIECKANDFDIEYLVYQLGKYPKYFGLDELWILTNNEDRLQKIPTNIDKAIILDVKREHLLELARLDDVSAREGSP